MEDGEVRRVETLRKVRIDPYHFVGGRFIGGIESPARTFNAGMRREFGVLDSGLESPRPGEELQPMLPGQHLFAGPLWNHFGHIMADSIHRLWAYSSERHDGIIYVGVKGLRSSKTDTQLLHAEIPATLFDLFALIGLPGDKIILVRQPTPVEALDVVELGAVPRVGMAEFYKKHLNRYQRLIEQSVHSLGRDWPERAYYGREHLKGGTLLGASYFRHCAIENGFREIIPEKLPLSEQFGTVIKADHIVFEEGSAAHIAEPLHRLSGRTHLLPRRRDSLDYDRSLSERSQYANLAHDTEVVLLPDAFGSLEGPRALAAYLQPDIVFARMRSLGLIAGSFSKRRYELAEEEDLARQSKAPDLQRGRQESLRAIQRRRDAS